MTQIAATALVPPTYGVKYAGSKARLLPWILELVRTLNVRTVLDAFSGTTRVSQALARLGYTVVANDWAPWSRVFAQTFLLNRRTPAYYRPLVDELNALPGKDGWFTEHYGGDADRVGEKKPWQRHNTRKLDAIREKIDQYALDEVETSTLLTALIFALDKVDNTLGHFGSYLRHWSARSYRPLTLETPDFLPAAKKHQVWQKDVFELLPLVETDLAYFDPPYGSANVKMPPSRVRYAGYYHLWKTVVLNDRPELFGKVNRRKDSADANAYSPFEDFRRDPTGKSIAATAIERLLREVRARYVLLSYSSGARATFEEVVGAIEAAGRLLRVQRTVYRRNVMAEMRWTHQWSSSPSPHYEYLFLMQK
ncbi:MAG: DNA adenine methylase [Bacteroidia bacterium]|nr:DNA adenine methylase [Bacteroidia bacterium]